MVLVEQRFAFTSKFQHGDKLSLFNQYLINGDVIAPNAESDIAHKLLYALTDRDFSIKDIIEEYSAKRPKYESPYIYKDLDIFLFICLIKKYEYPDDWVRSFLMMRKSEDEETIRLTQTFLNLLNQNFNSNDNYYEVVLVYFQIMGVQNIPEGTLNETYIKLNKKNFPFYSKDFLNIIALRAIDIIILHKGLLEYEDYSRLKEFSENFNEKTKKISITVFWVFTTIVFLITLIACYYFFFGDKRISDIVSKAYTVTGSFTFISLVALLIGKSASINFIDSRIQGFFGRQLQ